MSFEDIKIYRSWPIINGYVQVPHNKETDKTRVTVDEALASITGSQEVYFSPLGRNTGRGFGSQSFLELPEEAIGEGYDTNPVDQVTED